MMKKMVIDYEDGLQRFMNNDKLYVRFLQDFIDDKTMNAIISAYEAKNPLELKNSIHTLKGISGNLSLAILFGVCDELMVYIRQGNEMITEKMYTLLCKAYEEAIIEIKKLF